MAKKKSLTEERRERYIENLIEEAVINVLAEQEPPPSAVPPSPTPPAPETNAVDPAAEQLPEEEFTVDGMIDKLNVIRGGKSFSDPEVYARLVTYFNSLIEEEKADINKFLTELGSVVIDATEEEVEQEAPPSPTPQRQVQPSPPPQAPAPAPVAPTKPVSPSNI